MLLNKKRSLHHLTVLFICIGLFSRKAATMFFATKAILLKGYLNFFFFLAHFTNPTSKVLASLCAPAVKQVYSFYIIIKVHRKAFLLLPLAPARCVCAK